MKKEHTLIVVSLHDAQAECSCGGWYYTATGFRPRRHIEREHRLHVKNAEEWEEKP
jgi:hypothetical protein